ncbi:flagella basal body P-ring formation protein FlgA [Yoonia tamlensis]|uniref:Flagella basal body P-ring formation protein FlgA n=1 Tax=Yoonia tamlensis TaxID=390270 RepID=A0A1I6HBS1_9RHOB|nr:flagellar basal body P-ring formation chaperone FlgA [Yoonia tamlensis]SFR51810.1 flagella basal body P-ring formation protein FlgA [Yoonia tamlensis]
MIRALLILCLFASPVCADTVLAARTIPANTTILPEDIIVNSRTIPGGVTDPQTIIGMEARVALYAGRPIRAGDVGFPAVVERNQIIALHYQQHGLVISTEGRALGRAGPGDIIRVMNISSRSTVTAQIGADGAAYVSR